MHQTGETEMKQIQTFFLKTEERKTEDRKKKRGRKGKFIEHLCFTRHSVGGFAMDPYNSSPR